MGSTITKLVFRPPKPTPIKNDRFFYIEVPPETSFFACSPAETAGCSMMPTNLNKQISNTGPENGAHRIPAFFLLRRNAKLTLLYSHGNAEDLGMMYRRMKDLARVLEVNIMVRDAFDMPVVTESTNIFYNETSDLTPDDFQSVMTIPGTGSVDQNVNLVKSYAIVTLMPHTITSLML